MENVKIDPKNLENFNGSIKIFKNEMVTKTFTHIKSHRQTFRQIQLNFQEINIANLNKIFLKTKTKKKVK